MGLLFIASVCQFTILLLIRLTWVWFGSSPWKFRTRPRVVTVRWGNHGGWVFELTLLLVLTSSPVLLLKFMFAVIFSLSLRVIPRLFGIKRRFQTGPTRSRFVLDILLE